MTDEKFSNVDRPIRITRADDTFTPPPLVSVTALDLDANVYQAILDLIDDGVYIVDNERRVLHWNQGAERLTGFVRDEVLGRRCEENHLCHVDQTGHRLCVGGCPLEKAIAAGAHQDGESFMRHKQGHRIPVRTRTMPLRNQHHRLVGAVEVFRSIAADRKADQLIEELANLALLDDLTRLPNRRHFDIQLDRRLAELNRFSWPFGMLMIDIDHFKQVNDTFGHPMGDEILKLVGRTLSANCRVLDTVARWGGEEFVAIIANVEEDRLRSVAEKLRTMVECSSLPGAQETPIRVTVSIGGAMARPNETALELVARADEMLYAAKQGGRNRLCL